MAESKGPWWVIVKATRKWPDGLRVRDIAGDLLMEALGAGRVMSVMFDTRGEARAAARNLRRLGLATTISKCSEE